MLKRGASVWRASRTRSIEPLERVEPLERREPRTSRTSRTLEPAAGFNGLPLSATQQSSLAHFSLPLSLLARARLPTMRSFAFHFFPRTLVLRNQRASSTSKLLTFQVTVLVEATIKSSRSCHAVKCYQSQTLLSRHQHLSPRRLSV